MASGKETGTSVFDPVVCELAYRWFCPQGGQVLDPFAGGSVRGIVAAMLGRNYHGIDLRPEQVDANREQAARICKEPLPEWVCGDSLIELENAPEADFVFTCPPYADLERYSDDPRDISTMDYHTFCATYKLIVLRALQKLKRDRFACVVVGDIRDNWGFYRDFVGDTKAAFTAPGLAYYNEAILVTMVGSLPVRVGAQFTSGRKLGKTHQNVLVFVKGDPKKAAAACGVETEAA
jgi:DNA modification methylase